MTTRDRGWITWKPQKKTMLLVNEIKSVLEEYSDYLPLTIRQIFYRLVVSGHIDKTEQGYKKLCDNLTNARRSKMIPMSAIRDDGPTQNVPYSFENGRAYIDSVTESVRYGLVQFDRQRDQETQLVVWCEAAGMAPMLTEVATKYGIAVYSSGGFDSLTFKHKMSQRLSGKTVLHLGDYDPSGVHMFSSLEEDVIALAEDDSIQFVRLAVLEEHIVPYSLPTALPKKSDRRSFKDNRTVQCEAFPPGVLIKILQDAIESRIDLDIYAENMKREKSITKNVLKYLERDSDEYDLGEEVT